MAYTIKNTDGTNLVLLGDGKIDSNSTSLTLVGKNYSNYGEIWNNNLIQLMGHFSNASAPNSPLKGQLWYDSLEKKLKIYDEGWEPLNGAQISNLEPSFLSNGDLWFDSTNNQLYIRTEGATRLVGPAFSSLIGSNGWILPPVAIQNNASGSSGAVKKVTLLRNYGDTMGYVTNEAFTIATSPTYSYITSQTTSTVKGLTIFGDIRATEVSYTNTLTVASTIVYPLTERTCKKVLFDQAVQIGNFKFRIAEPGGPTELEPQVATMSGSANVMISGYYTFVSVANAQRLTQDTTLTTAWFDLITGGGLSQNVDGDVAEFTLTDTTDTNNYVVYKVTMQVIDVSAKIAVIAAQKLS